ncbi:MAG: type II secretion system F family protein [Sedimentibacter sp.]|uniref:type II secretion system F family protein n=1 Tax=Sedimentibacter sp. TaxID=1960295 RepID=UPI0031587D6A
MALYISLLFAICIFSAVVILLNSFGENSDRVKNRLSRLETQEKIVVIDDELNKSLAERFISPLVSSIVKSLGKLVPDMDLDNQKSENLRRMLRQAGLILMPSEYSAIRIIVVIGTSVLFFLLSFILNMDNYYVVLMPVLGAYAAFAVMRFGLVSRITQRKQKMESQLPDVLDMLSVNVEAGLGFEQAMLHVIEHFEGPLIDELNITYREMTMGRSRKDALTLLGERCDIDDLKSFTGSVIQANKLGISLKNILHTQADAIRESHRSKIEEQAHKMSIKILLPMVIFIFPVIFIVLMGPAVVSIMEVFGGQ